MPTETWKIKCKVRLTLRLIQEHQTSLSPLVFCLNTTWVRNIQRVSFGLLFINTSIKKVASGRLLLHLKIRNPHLHSLFHSNRCFTWCIHSQSYNKFKPQRKTSNQEGLITLWGPKNNNKSLQRFHHLQVYSAHNTNYQTLPYQTPILGLKYWPSATISALVVLSVQTLAVTRYHHHPQIKTWDQMPN